MHHREDLNRYQMLELLKTRYAEDYIYLVGGGLAALDLLDNSDDDELWIFLHAIETLSPIEFFKNKKH